jgi:hypothetical protein
MVTFLPPRITLVLHRVPRNLHLLNETGSRDTLPGTTSTLDLITSSPQGNHIYIRDYCTCLWPPTGMKDQNMTLSHDNAVTWIPASNWNPMSTFSQQRHPRKVYNHTALCWQSQPCSLSRGNLQPSFSSARQRYQPSW